MLIVKIEDAKLSLVLWRWSEEDFKIPLKIRLPDSTVSVFLDDPDRFSSRATRPRRRWQWVLHSTMLFQFENPTEDFRQGLSRPRLEKGEAAAKKILDDYLRCVDLIVTNCRLNLDHHAILEWSKSDLFDLFEGKFGRQTNVSWCLDGDTFTPFNFKPKKGGGRINPAFRSKSLIKPADWARLQRTISNGQVPPDEVKELLKLRSKVFWNEKRVSIVESAAIIEMALKNVVSNSLLLKGISKARLDSLREDATLSILLNLMLPMGLGSPTLKRALPLIQRIDKLRRLRNKIMHENLREQDIDEREAYEGIDSCIRLIMYLIRLGKWPTSRRAGQP